MTIIHGFNDSGWLVKAYNTEYNTKRRLSASLRLLLDDGERLACEFYFVDGKFDFLAICRVVEEIACLQSFSCLQLIMLCA